MSHKIIIVGIGPGDPAYLLPKARKIIEDARILVGGKRALADHSHSGVRECAIGADIPGVLDFIRDALAEDDVVVMVSGDPGYYSLCSAADVSSGSDRRCARHQFSAVCVRTTCSAVALCTPPQFSRTGASRGGALSCARCYAWYVDGWSEQLADDCRTAAFPWLA